MSRSLDPAPPAPEPSPDRPGLLRRAAPIAAAAIGLAALAWAAGETGGRKLVLAAVIGAVAGLALYHASFGFTGAWRRLQRERRGGGVRAQLLLLGAAVAVSYPLIAEGATGAWVFPVGLASAIGAATFGFGMQLGGGCGSGTLYTVGGGSTRMFLTLGGFLAGSVLWAGTREVWFGLPSLGAHSLIREFGAAPALLLTLAVLAALAGLTVWIERARHGALESWSRTGSLITGPWSRSLGALALAGVIIACFLTLGRPWGVTAAYPLWGGKIADAVGLPVRELAYFQGARLDRSIFADATSVMNMGVMLGALGAAGLAGRFAPSFRLSARDFWTAVIGGVLMGYGARLSYGCNVGGFLGGVASASLHGWWWLLFGGLGSVVGVWMRARLGMDPPAPGRAA